MSRSLWLLLLAAVGVSLGLVQGYSVAPRTGAWSGWTRTIQGQDHVSQRVVANFDSLKYLELFAGDKGNVANAYVATVYEDGDPVMSATGSQSHDCQWVRFENWDVEHAFTKGKVLECRFTRTGSGSDSINYYYSEASNGGPYAYGEMLVGGQAQPNRDLCARAYGVTDTVRRIWENMGTLPTLRASDSCIVRCERILVLSRSRPVSSLQA
jgi:hypothetical protein